MTGYFVMLYIGSNASRYKLDDLIHRSFNGYLDRDISCTEQKLYFPIAKDDDGYYLKPDYRSWNFRINGGEPVSVENRRICINHGDYLSADRQGFGYAALFLAEDDHSFSSCLYTTKFLSPVLIGRGDDVNIVIRSSDSVSRKHAVIQRDASGVCIEDISGKTGVYVNGARVSRKKLVNGDEISIGGIAIVFTANGLVVPSFVEVRKLQKADAISTFAAKDGNGQTSNEYIRTPRIYKSLEEGTIEIDPPTSPNKEKKVPFLLSIGPSLTMAMAMMGSVGVSLSNALQGGNISSVITGGLMAASMLTGAVLWPKLLRNYNEKQRTSEEQHRQSRYLSYIADIERDISRLYERNTRVWSDSLYPSPKNLLGMAKNHDRRIWERTPDDTDFLSVRLGVGDRPFEVDIRSPKQGFTLDDDEIAGKASDLAEKYKTLKNVPTTLSLIDKRTVGVIGDTHDVAKSILFSLAFFHASDEVKIVMVYNRFQETLYGLTSALPHTWSNDKAKRYAATTRAEAHALFSMLEEEIQKREAQLNRDEKRVPHYVVLVFDPSLLEEVAFKRYLLDYDNNIGVSAIFFGERFNAIPKECSAVVQKEESYCGIYFKNENNNRFMRYTPDKISDDDYSTFISSVAHINIKESGKAVRIPDRVSFLDSYQVGNIFELDILNRWNTNASDKSLAAIIGVRAGNEAFLLDIHEKYHGCHGLVAGTTGSGKSEFLQAYILSMMINFSPNEVNFVLIDFKGGDMARPFLDAPHLAATISNLSENILYRALVSLEAEVKSRQRVMNQAANELDVDKLDINSYHKYFKEKRIHTPLPHLIIVIDEFAQLKSQNPEFMSKLIDIAQVGRSLGIHLILATQKPSGVVDPQIWSNSRFKVCLKVTDKQDSMDMINHPEAAMIKLPGRAYVQVGYDEVFEQIQSGYSGADYIAKEKYVDDESVTVSLINAPGERLRSVKDVPASMSGVRKTQLEKTIEEICMLGEKQGLRSRKLWLAPLDEALTYEACDEQYKSFSHEKWDAVLPGKAVCGKLDLPEKQMQIPYSIDFLSEGHLAVYGSGGFGTSTFIQTLAYSMALRYSPEWFSVVVMDFDGGSLINLSNMPHCIGYALGDNESAIEQVLNHIQSVISKRRALFAKYNCANYESYIASSGQKLPVLLMILDNYAVFRESMYKKEERLIRLIAAAKACGVYAVISGNSKSAIYYRVMDHIANRIVFTMNDSGSYRDILNVRTPVKPDGIKGRALALHEGKPVEVQIAAPFDAVNEAERSKCIARVFMQMKKAYGGSVEKIEFDDGEEERDESPAPVVSRADRLSPMPPVSAMDKPLMIGTSNQTGMACGFETAGCQRIFIANPIKQDVFAPLVTAACETGSNVYVFSSKTVDLPQNAQYIKDADAFIGGLMTMDKELSGICIIDGFTDFFDIISDDSLEKLEKFLRKKQDGCWIAIDDMTRIRNGYRDTELFGHLVRANNGLVIGGGINNDIASMLHQQFNEIPVAIRAKTVSRNQGFAYIGTKGACVDLWS